MKRKKRIYSLDFLKILATIAIIFHHYQIYTKTHFAAGINFVGGRFNFAYLVELFFVLSGYFMFPYIEKIRAGMDFQHFFAPKYLRFLLPTTVTVLGFALFDVQYERLYGTQFFGRTVQLWGIVVSSLGFSSGWGIENPKMNGTIWYISVLFICYVVFYLIVFLSRKIQVVPYWMFAFMIFLSFSITTNGIDLLFLNSGTARGLSSFFWGLILAKVMRGKPISAKWALISLVGFGALAALILFGPATFLSAGQNYLYTFCMYPFLLVLFQTKPARWIFRSRFWGWLGNISFEAYIWHFPLLVALMVFDKQFGWNINYAARIYSILLAVVSFAIGIVSYYLIEKPASAYFKRKII